MVIPGALGDGSKYIVASTLHWIISDFVPPCLLSHQEKFKLVGPQGLSIPVPFWDPPVEWFSLMRAPTGQRENGLTDHGVSYGLQSFQGSILFIVFILFIKVWEHIKRHVYIYIYNYICICVYLSINFLTQNMYTNMFLYIHMYKVHLSSI